MASGAQTSAAARTTAREDGVADQGPSALPHVPCTRMPPSSAGRAAYGAIGREPQGSAARQEVSRNGFQPVPS